MTLFFGTGSYQTLSRDAYSGSPIYFLNYPVKNHSGNKWVISESLRNLGLHVRNRPDPEGIRDYLCYGFVPAPRTIFKGVSAVPPGMLCRLPCDHDRPEWYPINRPPKPIQKDPETAFWNQICSQVKFQQASLLLSGGLDSAMIAVAARESGTKIDAYHARFRGAGTTDDSDTQAARTIARHLDIQYNELVINSWDALRWFKSVINHLDQPMGDPVILPFYLVFKMINSDNRRIVLTGEGGDQLFGSWSMKPMLVREMYGEVNYLRDSGYLASYHKFDSEWPNLMSSRLVSYLDNDSKAESPIAASFANAPSLGFCNQLRWVDLQLKGIQHILPRIGAMAKPYKLQLQHPFFHPEIIDLSLALPDHLKLARSREKVLLKTLAASRLPIEVVERRKQGMGVPTSSWFRRGLRPLVGYLMNTQRLRQSGLLNPEYVHDSVLKNTTTKDGRTRRWGDRLWMLCTLEAWFASLSTNKSSAGNSEN
ncbi:MAG: asparagine synthase C-terminal domain-containing protein [Methylococcaceae bacterium]